MERWEPDLLDALRERSGVEYLSDLRQGNRRHSVTLALRNAVAGLDPSAWPAEAWREAAVYLLDQPFPTATAEEIAAELLNRL